MDQSRRFIVPGQNRLLSALSRDLQIRLLPRMERVVLTVRQLLFEAGEPITHVYFPLSGAMSLIIALDGGGESVEIATIGNEGMIGTAVFLGADRGPMRAVCQVAGQALKMRSESFRHSVAEHPDLADVVRHFTQTMINQISQTTACNQVHSVQQRMCRWLLMTHDRVGADEFHLTQELLAQMLGVRRPSVTVAAGLLQRDGLISYQRGRIRIADRAALEAASCPCYQVVRQDIDSLIAVS
jgi:CRP-like cAMP-binding protein